MNLRLYFPTELYQINDVWGLFCNLIYSFSEIVRVICICRIFKPVYRQTDRSLLPDLVIYKKLFSWFCTFLHYSVPPDIKVFFCSVGSKKVKNHWKAYSFVLIDYISKTNFRVMKKYVKIDVEVVTLRREKMWSATTIKENKENEKKTIFFVFLKSF